VTRRGAAFVDRDGTINQLAADPQSGLPESPLDPSDVRLIPGAAAALKSLAEAGLAIVCVTNQPAAAKGKVSLERLLAVHERVLELLREAGAGWEISRVCLHHPAAVRPDLAGRCDCRKPAPGMLFDAAAELDLDLTASWMLGDSDDDAAAGRAAGCRTVLIRHPDSAHRRSGAANADFDAVDLTQAASIVLAARAA
jgi:D-glycero-D-manno-heptose 1,7-bisphosphate phosphatase